MILGTAYEAELGWKSIIADVQTFSQNSSFIPV